MQKLEIARNHKVHACSSRLAGLLPHKYIYVCPCFASRGSSTRPHYLLYTPTDKACVEVHKAAGSRAARPTESARPPGRAARRVSPAFSQVFLGKSVSLSSTSRRSLALHIHGGPEDAETVEKLNESGELRKMLRPYKSPDACTTCQACGGFRLLPCRVCSGSKKSLHRNHFTAEFVALKCMSCDEVGLVRCEACS